MTSVINDKKVVYKRSKPLINRGLTFRLKQKVCLFNPYLTNRLKEQFFNFQKQIPFKTLKSHFLNLQFYKIVNVLNGISI